MSTSSDMNPSSGKSLESRKTPLPEDMFDSKSFSDAPPAYSPKSASTGLDAKEKQEDIDLGTQDLLESLRDFDTKVLLDDSGSMAAGRRWTEVSSEYDFNYQEY